MRVLLVFVLIFGGFLRFAICQGWATEIKESPSITQKTSQLKLSLVADKRIFRHDDYFRLHAMLINTDYVNDIFVYGTLGWGYSASLTFTLRDSSGREIHPQIVPDDLTPPLTPDDTTAFVKLRPQHYLGTDLRAKLNLLNLSKPGKYSVRAEYHSPILGTEVKLSPFWGKEKGTIKSNIVWFEIIR
jgi:hypothetical protein